MTKKNPVLLVGLLVVCTAVWGQTPGASINRNNSIEISVRSRTGGDITQLIRVELFRGDIPLMETYANQQGEATFYNLEDGSYTVRASSPDFRAERLDVQLNSGVGRQLTFLLMAKSVAGTAAPVPADPIVSVRWLSAPEKARKEILKSRELRDKGDFPGAMEHLRKALEIHPGFSIALNEQGLCYVREEKLGEARESYEKAIQNDAEFLLPYLNLAEVWVKEKEYNRAAQILAQAAKAQPTRGEPFYAIAKIQLDTGHLDRAEQAARMALERDVSRIPDVHILLVNIYNRRGEKDKVAAELEAYLQKAPNGPHAEQARATLAKIKQ